MLISLGGKTKRQKWFVVREIRRSLRSSQVFLRRVSGPAAWVVGLTQLNVCKMLNSGFQGAAPRIKGSSHDVTLVSVKNIGLTGGQVGRLYFHRQASACEIVRLLTAGGQMRDYFSPRV